jgi:hypothetical protein
MHQLHPTWVLTVNPQVANDHPLPPAVNMSGRKLKRIWLVFEETAFAVDRLPLRAVLVKK